METEKIFIPPTPGEAITSLMTKNTYIIGNQIGEGNFGSVYSCTDLWNNELAVKVLKPKGTYQQIKERAEAEFQKLIFLRNPFITFVFDAFEYRDTFYIITERCHMSGLELFKIKDFNGLVWIKAVSRCILQAVNFLHINNFVHQDIHLGNIFVAFIKDELLPQSQSVMQFKIGDLGITRMAGEVSVSNTRALWMLPPEVINTSEFGPIDHRVDIYHIGLLLLQFVLSKKLTFTEEEIISGVPRTLAKNLPHPYNIALEKTLRRHVIYRTASAAELWRDLNIPSLPALSTAP